MAISVVRGQNNNFNYLVIWINIFNIFGRGLTHTRACVFSAWNKTNPFPWNYATSLQHSHQRLKVFSLFWVFKGVGGKKAFQAVQRCYYKYNGLFVLFSEHFKSFDKTLVRGRDVWKATLWKARRPQCWKSVSHVMKCELSAFWSTTEISVKIQWDLIIHFGDWSSSDSNQV